MSQPQLIKRKNGIFEDSIGMCPQCGGKIRYINEKHFGCKKCNTSIDTEKNDVSAITGKELTKNQIIELFSCEGLRIDLENSYRYDYLLFKARARGKRMYLEAWPIKKSQRRIKKL